MTTMDQVVSRLFRLGEYSVLETGGEGHCTPLASWWMMPSESV